MTVCLSHSWCRRALVHRVWVNDIARTGLLGLSLFLIWGLAMAAVLGLFSWMKVV